MSLGWSILHHFTKIDSNEAIQDSTQAFEMGRDVNFGTLVLSQEGICSKDDIIPWSALRSFHYENRELILVRQQGNIFSSSRFHAKKLKNLPILLHLLHHYSHKRVAALSR
jgi:hypothetical protein